MPVRSARRTVVSGLLAVASLALAAGPSVAAEPVALHLRLAADAVVSGTTTFDLVISDVTGYDLTRATDTVGTQSGSVDLAPHECEPVCDSAVTVDTVPVPDGVTTLRITAFNAAGEVQHADFSVRVGNDPRLGVSPVSGSGQFTARSTLTVLAYPDARGGATVAGVRWVDANTSGTFAPPSEPGEPWSLTVGTASLSEGAYTGSVVAPDSRGRRATRSVEYGVVRTLSISGPDLSGTVDDHRLDQLPIRFSHAAGVRDAEPVLLTTTLDGVEVSRVARPELVAIDDAYANGTVSAGTGGRVTPGSHRLTVTLLDSRGLTRSLDYRLTVRQTLAARWTAGQGSTVVVGSAIDLKAAVQVTGVVVDCTVTLDGRAEVPPTGCSGGSGSREVRVPLTIADTGRPEHPVVLTVRPDRGQPVVLRTTITTLPRLVGVLEATAGGRPGEPVVLTGSVGGSGGQPVFVVLQKRDRGLKTWRRLAGATTRADGGVSFTVTPRGTADYRLVTRSRPGAWGGSVGPSRTVKVASTLRVTKKPATVARGAEFSVEGSTRPAGERPTVTLQAYAVGDDPSWVEVGRVRSDTDGALVFARRQYSPVQRYRLVRENSDEAYGSVSDEFVVTLK